MYEKDIMEKIQQLPEVMKKVVLQYVESLWRDNNNKKKKKKKFAFDWEGGLSELKGQYSSVELQHKTLEWR